MKRFLPVLFIAPFFMLPGSAAACSPAPSWPPSAAENLAAKDIAFVGTVRSVVQDKSVNGDYRITFAVEETRKGDLGKTVTIRTRSSSAACGYDEGYDTFEKGSIWAIYATGSEKEGYETDSLSLNATHDSIADARKAFDPPPTLPKPIACTMEYAPVCGRAPDGTVKTYGNACMLRAEKATQLYAGECRTVPESDLRVGSRGEDVSWLQKFLMSANVGAAAQALSAVGPTDYFGAVTRAALAEFQAHLGITPAAGYFGSKTRAAVSAMLAATEGPRDEEADPETFTGEISAVNTGCFTDGICSVTVDGKEVILLTGLRVPPIPPVGSLEGVDSIGDLEDKIGSRAEVRALPVSDGTADYTLYGSTEYYVKVLK